MENGIWFFSATIRISPLGHKLKWQNAMARPIFIVASDPLNENQQMSQALIQFENN